MECKVFANAKFSPTQEDLHDEEKAMYESILSLRCYLQKEHNSLKWNAIMSLESHNDIRRDKELWKREQVSIYYKE